MAVVLSSNCGHWAVSLELHGRWSYASQAGADANLCITGEHWDGDHSHDLGTKIESIWLRASDLADMSEFLRAWCEQPLEQLVGAELVGDFGLAHLPGQRLDFRFGPRDDTISSLNPVVTIAYAVGRLSGQCHFVTDQSCLTSFVSELDAELRESAA